MCEFYKNGKCKFKKEGICEKYKSRADNLSLHCAGFWSEDKVRHFKYYADMFSTGMKNRWHNRYYIDLFAGPGKCIIRENFKEINGTCLEVFNLKDKFTKYFFIDKNSICIKDLKKRLADNSRVDFINDDCNLALNNVVKYIPEFSISLAIIDPDSLQLNFDSFKILSKIKGDLIINYPIGPVERAVSAALAKNNYKTSRLDKFHPGWREIVTKKSWGCDKKQNIRNLVADYIKKICDLGYFSAKLNLVPFKNSKNTTMYFLIAFSKSEKGIDFWKKKEQGLKNKNRQQPLF